MAWIRRVSVLGSLCLLFALVVTISPSCVLGADTTSKTGPGHINDDVMAWLLANNPGLTRDFLKKELPDKLIKLPDGSELPIYKLKQFLGVNFRLTFHAIKKEGMAIVNQSEFRLRRLMARPEFRQWILKHRGNYRISGKGQVSASQAYNHFRNINKRLGVTANKKYSNPAGGGNRMVGPSWAVWKAMNIFEHEACHCIGIGHNSGGLSGPLAGQLRKWDRQKKWDYETIDLNAFTAKLSPVDEATR